MAVSAETGRLLYVLARARQARRVVEFGTSFGVSTLHLAAAVKDSGGGLVVGTEFEESKAARVRETIARAGADDVVQVRSGDALETLALDPVQDVELLFLDDAKQLYPAVLELVRPQLAERAVVVADNASRSPAYLELVTQGPEWVTSVLPASDLSVSVLG